ncbi:hypothetical protein I4U23_025634 [Adineta vaga]|nr:hypothetical protein I4U23_025634 [Adineta vaga]
MFCQVYFFILIIPIFRRIDGVNVQEENLMNMLFGKNSQYNALITPVANASEPLVIHFGLTLAQIINVYEKEQIVKVNVWLQLRWYDYQMRWNPDRFDHLESIRVPPEKVWTPDLVLFNNADGNYEVSYRANAVISSEGKILWIPIAIFKLTCTINVEYFPFDQQTCGLRFGSTGLSASQVRFDWYATENSMELSDYVTSGTWTLLSAPAKIRIIKSSEPPYESRTEMVFSMIIQRRPLFYTINLIVPTMMISLLTITLFCLPSDAAEKMGLCTSILVALVFFMLLVSRILPPTSISIPLISKYLMFTFIMNLLTVCLSVLSLYLNHHRILMHTPIPYWVRIIFLHALPTCLFLHKPCDYHRTCEREESPMNSPLILRKIKTRQRKLPMEMNYLIEQFLERSNDIKYISKKIAANTEEMQIFNDWKYISLVIDRIQLFIFLSVTFIGTIALFFQIPKLFDSQRDVL